MRDARTPAPCDLGFPNPLEPSAAVEPRNRPFDDPTAWKHYKSFGVIGALDDFSFEIGEDFRQGLLEFRSLIAAVGKQLF